MNVDLSKALGKKHYNILKRVFMKEPYQGLTMNEILDQGFAVAPNNASRQ